MNQTLWSRPRMMGIVNINDDSFSGDGTLDISEALDLASQMVRDGADIIDIGAESARTNREAITTAEEIDRLLPFLDAWESATHQLSPRHQDQLFPPLISVNSWRPEVVESVLKTGQVDLINDIGGLADSTNAELCAKYDAHLLIMHTVGLPKMPHLSQEYVDLWQAVEDFFDEKIALALKSGLTQDKIILDPGIDFAKQREDNLLIFREIERLNRYGYPILLPISRKTVIGEVLDLPEPVDRDGGTIACLSRGIQAGATIFRVHNVKASAEASLVLSAIKAAPPKP